MLCLCYVFFLLFFSVIENVLVVYQPQVTVYPLHVGIPRYQARAYMELVVRHMQGAYDHHPSSLVEAQY